MKKIIKRSQKIKRLLKERYWWHILLCLRWKLHEVKVERFLDEKLFLEKSLLMNNAIIYVTSVFYDGEYFCDSQVLFRVMCI